MRAGPGREERHQGGGESLDSLDQRCCWRLPGGLSAVFLPIAGDGLWGGEGGHRGASADKKGEAEKRRSAWPGSRWERNVAFRLPRSGCWPRWGAGLWTRGLILQGFLRLACLQRLVSCPTNASGLPGFPLWACPPLPLNSTPCPWSLPRADVSGHLRRWSLVPVLLDGTGGRQIQRGRWCRGLQFQSLAQRLAAAVAAILQKWALRWSKQRA